MSGILSLSTAMMAASLFSAQVNDNGTTGEWRVHTGSPGTVHEMEVEVDPSDAVIAGVLPNTGWVSALGFEMRGRNSTFDFATSTNAGSMWCINGSVEQFADVRLHVPHNAQITFFRMWGYDGSTDHNLSSYLFESCLPNISAGAPTNTILAQLDSSDSPGNFTETTALASPQPVTDTRNCTYWARARFANDCQGGGDLILRKFRIQYTLVP